MGIIKGLEGLGETDTVYDELSDMGGLAGLFGSIAAAVDPADALLNKLKMPGGVIDVSKRTGLNAQELSQLKTNLDNYQLQAAALPNSFKKTIILALLQECNARYVAMKTATNKEAQLRIAQQQQFQADSAAKAAAEAAKAGDIERAKQQAALAQKAADAATESGGSKQKADAAAQAANSAVAQAEMQKASDTASPAATTAETATGEGFSLGLDTPVYGPVTRLHVVAALAVGGMLTAVAFAIKR